MKCEECYVEMVEFEIPEIIKRMGNEFERYISICPVCFEFSQQKVEGGITDLDGMGDLLPNGEIGKIMSIGIALLLESIVMNKKIVLSIFEYVINEGRDPWIVLENLSNSTENKDLSKKIDKAIIQLEQLVE